MQNPTAKEKYHSFIFKGRWLRGWKNKTDEVTIFFVGGGGPELSAVYNTY
jgi:hypothetical protein